MSKEVQDALQNFGEYAHVGRMLEGCRDSNSDNICYSRNPTEYNDAAPCDTTWALAELSHTGSVAGHFAGFRTSRSYFALRDMQQRAGFMVEDEDGEWHCTRPSNLYEGITCPKGHFKRSEIEFLHGCAQVGLNCDDKEEYDCFCKPCVKAFEVDVYEHKEGEEDDHLLEHFGESLPGCEKMSICGTIEQGESIKLRIFDNMERDNAVVSVTVHAGDLTTDLELLQLKESPYGYEFTVTDDLVQVQVIDVLVNGEPISQSPIRVIVKDKDCDAEYGIGSNRSPNDVGTCVCMNNTYQMGNSCMESHFFFLIIFASVFALLGVVLMFFLAYKKKQSDSVWHVGVDELQFSEPPDVIGQGGFGVVVLGQYRGTKVAVKRVLPPAKKGNSRGSVQMSGSMEGPQAGSGTMSGEMGAKAPRKGKKKSGTTSVSFNPKASGDIEANAKRATTSHSMTSKLWDDFMRQDSRMDNALKILETATSIHGSSTMMGQGATQGSQQGGLLSCIPLWMRFDEHSRLKREFITEMRLLSRLRHPCITTVMGAVIAPRADPMLVMEFMEYGSLHDLLRNDTLYAGGEIILQIIRDITQGIQFLHASRPPILHGDLKAKNILVDSR